MIQVRFAKYDEYDEILKVAPSVCKKKFKQWTDDKQVAIAYLDGEVAGWVQYDFFGGTIPFVNEIYVLEQCRRQSVGSFLLLYCEDAVKNLGYNKIMLSTLEENPAIAFYKRLGYRQLGEFDCFGDHKEQLYGKELKEHSCCCG